MLAVWSTSCQRKWLNTQIYILPPIWGGFDKDISELFCLIRILVNRIDKHHVDMLWSCSSVTQRLLLTDWSSDQLEQMSPDQHTAQGLTLRLFVFSGTNTVDYSFLLQVEGKYTCSTDKLNVINKNCLSLHYVLSLLLLGYLVKEVLLQINTLIIILYREIN